MTALLQNLGAPMPVYQVLAYPVVDRFDRWPSYAERGTGYVLDQFMRWQLGHYLPEGARAEDPYLCPLAADDLSGLPPTSVLTAEFDALRDEGVAYAKRSLAGARTERHAVPNH